MTEEDASACWGGATARCTQGAHPTTSDDAPVKTHTRPMGATSLPRSDRTVRPQAVIPAPAPATKETLAAAATQPALVASVLLQLRTSDIFWGVDCTEFACGHFSKAIDCRLRP